MNRKIVGVLLCMLMVAAIPVAAGMQCDTGTEEPLGPFSKTTVRGFILGSSTDGWSTSFFALRVKYTTTNLFGEQESDVLILQRVTFTGKLIGHLGKFYISGIFHGTP